MRETNETKATIWNQPLKGWRWLAGWTVVIVTLTALTRIILGLATNQSSGGPTALPWWLFISIAVAAAMLLGLLARSLSSGRNFKRLLLGLACLAGLIVLSYAEEDVRGRLAWRQFKAQWEAKGEKFDLVAFIPPMVPDERNFAMAPVVSTTYGQMLDRNGHQISPQNTNVVNRLQMPLDAGDGGPTNGIGNWRKAISSNLEPWQRYYRELALKTNLFPVAPQPQTAAADVLLALSKYDSTIEELRGAAALPASRYPVNYDSEDPYTMVLPHLGPLKGCVGVLRSRALAELEAGQSEKALADISLGLRLAENIRSEPFLISQLVRIAMLQITAQVVWEGLATHCWTDAQLSELDQQLASLDFVADYQRTMRAETAWQAAETDFLRHHPNQLRNMEFYDFGEGGSARLPDLPVHFIPSGWFYQNELRSSQFILENFLPIGDVRQQTISRTLAKEADEALRTMRRTPYHMLGKMFLFGLVNSPRTFAVAQTTVNLARTACALERHRLAHGKYPETLDALAPQLIAKVPHDPVGGQPLHYRLTDNGQFILYSVGWNEKDDGGIVSLKKGGLVDLDNDDWVWRYPDSPKP
jgi:hypothetical protein